MKQTSWEGRKEGSPQQLFAFWLMSGMLFKLSIYKSGIKHFPGSTLVFIPIYLAWLFQKTGRRRRRKLYNQRQLPQRLINTSLMENKHPVLHSVRVFTVSSKPLPFKQDSIPFKGKHTSPSSSHRKLVYPTDWHPRNSTHKRALYWRFYYCIKTPTENQPKGVGEGIFTDK